MNAASSMSARASAIGLPQSRTSSTASSSAASRMPSARRASSPARRRGAPSPFHRPSSTVARAAPTARATSIAPHAGTLASDVAVAGSSVSKRAPDAASTHSPPMKACTFPSAVVMSPTVLGGSESPRGRLTGPTARPFRISRPRSPAADQPPAASRRPDRRPDRHSSRAGKLTDREYHHLEPRPAARRQLVRWVAGRCSTLESWRRRKAKCGPIGVTSRRLTEACMVGSRCHSTGSARVRAVRRSPANWSRRGRPRRCDAAASMCHTGRPWSSSTSSMPLADRNHSAPARMRAAKSTNGSPPEARATVQRRGGRATRRRRPLYVPREPVPVGIADLLQPVGDHLVTSQRLEHRGGGLAPLQRRDVDLVERFVGNDAARR